MNTGIWSQVRNRPDVLLEFGASHVNHAWRRHKRPQNKFLGLESAFKLSNHRLQLLLQAVNSNYNARNHPVRGQAIFAAVWFRESPWGILCSATHATLVERTALECIAEQSGRNDETMNHLRDLFDSTPSSIQQQLDDSFYERVLRNSG